jgi:hypothetical protein
MKERHMDREERINERRKEKAKYKETLRKKEKGKVFGQNN